MCAGYASGCLRRSAVLALVVLAAGVATTASAQDASVRIPGQKVDPALRAQLPENIRTAGKLVSANNSSFPPYTIVVGSNQYTGASVDLATAVGELLGVRIEHVSVNGLSGQLTGIKAGRFQFAIGPVGDFKYRQQQNDFVDWVQEFVVFAVPKGNPTKIADIADTCGQRIAVMAAGSAEIAIREQSKQCVAKGKPEVQVQTYADQPTSILAVRSKRADAFFSSQAPLTYYAQQAKGELELVALGRANGFADLYQGAVVPKGSPLGPVLVSAINTLIANGTYGIVMKKWGLGGNQIAKAGLNLSTH